MAAVDVGLIIAITVPVGTTILGVYLDRWLTKKPKLISYIGHTSAFNVRGENAVVVHTHSVVVRNAGRLTANNVRIGHNFLPDSFQLYPSVAHSVERIDNGGADILIPTLVPGEQVTISYLYYPPVFWNHINAYAKSDEGLAQYLNVLPTPQLSRWQVRGIWLLMLVGGITILYLLMKLVLHYVR